MVFSFAVYRYAPYVTSSVYQMGLEPFWVDSNGNCFFNSISVLMSGTEENYAVYRLGATVYGCTHFEHLVSSCV